MSAQSQVASARVRFEVEAPAAAAPRPARPMRFATVEELLAPKRVELRVLRAASEASVR